MGEKFRIGMKANESSYWKTNKNGLFELRGRGALENIFEYCRISRREIVAILNSDLKSKDPSKTMDSNNVTREENINEKKNPDRNRKRDI